MKDEMVLLIGNSSDCYVEGIMAKYRVSYRVIYSVIVEADSPREAADIVDSSCPYDVDGCACVVDMETGEEYEE